jgi:hypothetical protein
VKIAHSKQMAAGFEQARYLRAGRRKFEDSLAWLVLSAATNASVTYSYSGSSLLLFQEVLQYKWAFLPSDTANPTCFAI